MRPIRPISCGTTDNRNDLQSNRRAARRTYRSLTACQNEPGACQNKPGACQNESGTDEGWRRYDGLCGLNEPAWKGRHSPGVAQQHGATMIFDDEDTHSYHRARPLYPVAAYERLIGAAAIDVVLRIALLHEPQATALACGLNDQQASLVADIQATDLRQFAAALLQRLYPATTDTEPTIQSTLCSTHRDREK